MRTTRVILAGAALAAAVILGSATPTAEVHREPSRQPKPASTMSSVVYEPAGAYPAECFRTPVIEFSCARRDRG